MNIAVAGLGFMGATHLQAWSQVPGSQVVAVVSGDAKKLSGDLTGIHGNIGAAGEVFDFSSIARYRTLDECLRDPNIDAIDLCVPTDLHEELAISAMCAGKHVLVEKPIALDGTSADRMIDEATRAGRVLMCAQVLRFLPAYAAAADELPALGTMRSAMFRRRCGRPSWATWLADPARSGGAVFDLLIHDVDYTIKLFGPPRSVSATGFSDMRFGIDWMVAELRYDATGPVVIEGGWYHPAAYPFSMEFTIMAEGGTLDYSSDSRPLKLLSDGADDRTLAISPTDGFVQELHYFAQCVSERRHPDLCPPSDSALAVRLMRRMLELRGI